MMTQSITSFGGDRSDALDEIGSEDELTESISELPSIAQKGKKKPGIRRQSEVDFEGTN